MLSFGITAAILLLFMTNFAVSIFDQVDVIPIYESNCMIFKVIAGLTILGEDDRYSTGDLIGISIGIMITVSGIFVLGYKKTDIETTKDEKQE